MHQEPIRCVRVPECGEVHGPYSSEVEQHNAFREPREHRNPVEQLFFKQTYGSWPGLTWSKRGTYAVKRGQDKFLSHIAAVDVTTDVYLGSASCCTTLQGLR